MTIGRDDRIEYDTSGITTEDGLLDRYIPGGGWVIPNVVAMQRKPERLFWQSDWPLGHRAAYPGPGLLEGFLRLADGKPEDVMEYAYDWGVLYICEHGLPRSHLSSAAWFAGSFVLPSYRRVPYAQCELLEFPLSEMNEIPMQLWIMQYYEPIAAWRKYSRMARTLLDLAAGLDRGKLAPEADWRSVNGGSWILPSTVDEGRSELGRVLGGWLTIGRVAPYLDWTSAVPEIRLTVSGLFGAIGMQLLMALGRSEGFAVCSACGALFSPHPKPRTGSRRYCDTCRAMGAPARDASADYRRRKKAKGTSDGEAR